MKNLLITLVLSFIGISSFAQNDLSGTWGNSEAQIQVNIYLKNNCFMAKVISSNNPVIKEGEIIAKDIKQVKHKWKGLMYVHEKQEWVNIEGKTSKRYLYVKDFSGFFTKSHTWKRI